jgi:molybdopterin molybdotransferase
MLSFEQALERLLAAAQPVTEIRSQPLTAAAGRVLALAQRSTVAVPPLDNSGMDGYAVRSADVTAAGVCLPVSQRIPAGMVGTALQPGTARRRCRRGRRRVIGTLQHGDRGWSSVPHPGKTSPAGETSLGRHPQPIVAPASPWPPRAAELPVYRRLRVGVFFTGDELVQPGEPLPPGAIYNSNRYALRALLEGMGCEVRDLGTVPDNLDATRDALRRAAADNDLIITSGGVSVGEEDHVKPAVEAEGRLDVEDRPSPSRWPSARAASPRHGLVHRPAGQPVWPWSPHDQVAFILRLQGSPTRKRCDAADFAWPRPDVRPVRRLNGQASQLFPSQGSGVHSLAGGSWSTSRPARRGEARALRAFRSCWHERQVLYLPVSERSASPARRSNCRPASPGVACATGWRPGRGWLRKTACAVNMAGRTPVRRRRSRLLSAGDRGLR